MKEAEAERLLKIAPISEGRAAYVAWWTAALLRDGCSEQWAAWTAERLASGYAWPEEAPTGPRR